MSFFKSYFQAKEPLWPGNGEDREPGNTILKSERGMRLIHNVKQTNGGRLELHSKMPEKRKNSFPCINMKKL